MKIYFNLGWTNFDNAVSLQPVKFYQIGPYIIAGYLEKDSLQQKTPKLIVRRREKCCREPRPQVKREREEHIARAARKGQEDMVNVLIFYWKLTHKIKELVNTLFRILWSNHLKSNYV